MHGKWIIEVGELSGLRGSKIESLKAFLSRRKDRARLAYGRLVTEAPRECVIFGTTNSTEYLADDTGNRRFWPVRVTKFDIDALRRDRDQLWAEASVRESAGESIRLDPELWPAASEEQAQRFTEDPYVDALQDALGERVGKIATESLWTILEVKAGARSKDQSRRVGAAMRKLGWRRNAAGSVKIDGESLPGFAKGEEPHATVKAHRGLDGRLVVESRGGGSVIQTTIGLAATGGLAVNATVVVGATIVPKKA